MKNFLISLKNRQDEKVDTTKKTDEKVIKKTPETSKVESATPTTTPTPTPTPLGTLTSLVESYKKDGDTKGKVGSIKVDFGNELDKALYSVRESKNKLKPAEERALQEIARLSGMDEAQIRKLGEDVASKIKDKIYREKEVSPLTQRYQELIASNEKE